VSTDLDGRVAIVTGGARGLGLAASEALAAWGARVVISDIDEAAAEGAAAGIPGARAFRCDARDEGQVRRLVEDTVAADGRLDILVANAGIGQLAPLATLDLAGWREVTSLNLDGTFLAIRHGGPAIAGSGGGAIVAIASILAFAAAPGGGAYGAAKAGVVSLVRTAALELRAQGVRVNAICPGFFETALVEGQRATAAELLGVDLDPVVEAVQGRYGRPEEVGRVAAWLASDRAAMVSGAAYVIDGGAKASIL